MRTPITRYVFTLVALGSLGASAFRVSTASDRVRERHDTARQVCTERGGAWQTVGRSGQCSTATIASRT